MLLRSFELKHLKTQRTFINEVVGTFEEAPPAREAPPAEVCASWVLVWERKPRPMEKWMDLDSRQSIYRCR